MTDVKSRLQELSPEKRALLLDKLKQKAQAAESERAIPRRPDQDTRQLSFAQQQMWTLDQMEPGSPFYNIAMALRLTGRLDVQAWEASLNEVVRRHDQLRACFVTEHGRPVQMIAPELTLPVVVEPCSPDMVEAVAAEEARRPFNLSQAPLLRARLLAVGEEDHVALLTIHHIITDGWSMGVLVRELSLLYQAFVNGQPNPLAPLPIQYSDYAHWQRQRLQGDYLANELAFWREQLRGIPPMLELPTDRPRPTVQTVNGAIHSFTLPASVAAGLHALGRRENATLFQTLLAAFMTLLYRYSSQDDICVGVPVANRIRPELEPLIGYFVNTVVMRGNLAGRPSFREMLRRVREQTLAAQAHQELPFEMVVDEIQPKRNLSITPIFQVLFDLQQVDSQTVQLPGLTITPIETHSGTSKVDMTLFLVDSPDGLTGAIEYNTDLWDASSIERMATHLQVMLTSLATDEQAADQPITRLPLATQAEQQQVLVQWNDTTADIPRDRSLARLFEEQVERSPDAVAVIYDDQQLTYRQLNQRANQLAHALRSRGIGPDVLVGVYMDRSLDMMVTLLGIVKAGGAYLPLDTQYPPDRLAFMLRDSQAPVVLTQAHLVPHLPTPEQGGVPADGILRIDADWEKVARYSTDNPVDLARPDHLAYVIYTSGSTGIPKGVAVPQRAITRLVFNTNYMPFWPGMRMAQVSNASFDAATWEIWGAWLHGGVLVGIRKDIALSPREFAAALQSNQIDTIFLTTALFNLISSEAPEAFGSLQYVLFGGEACDARWVRRVLEHKPPKHLLNVYGPTESTTYSTWYEVTAVPENARTLPIGAALSNTTLYVLDPSWQPTPVGVPGQLCIGGEGLARDYLHRPDLTASRFVPDPFSGQPGARMYLTGDLVRWLPDGQIDFLGRIDTQVKIRGFRVELGEIEARLHKHPAIQDAVVLARDDWGGGDSGRPGERRLVAYVVPKGDTTPAVSELRSFLQEQLPDYMVPAAFVVMPSLPINPNGKVDRKALPVPDQERPDLDRAYVAPRTAVERFLVEQWQEVLGLQRIGVYDNFFELGGNSLQAAVLINRVQERTGVSAHVRALFMAPTVADLAIYMAEYYPQATAQLEALAGGAAGDERQAESGQTEAKTATTPAAPEQAAGTPVDPTKLALLRRIIVPLAPRAADDGTKNRPAVFLLSPPRSGSTLLRVMLAGNPRLFAPPELDLLSFNTLPQRRAAFSGKYAFWLEGVQRAIMEIKGVAAEQAQAIMDSLEERQLTTKQFYRQLQEWVGDRLLVDKTPVYALDPNILRRAEEDFADARYIHLVRHPYATIHSFTEAKLDQLFFRYEHPFTLRELGEMIWIISHQNILQFLEGIPPERQHRVWFEELVGNPEPVMRGICDFLQIPFDPAMLEPYQADRMTSGVRPDHQMVGDFKFYLRNRIDPKAADRWKRLQAGGFLSDIAWDIAEKLGYRREEVAAEQRAGRKLSKIERVPRPAAGAELADLAAQPLPLSFAQQRLWFLDQLEPGSPFYNVPAAVRLTGAVSLPAVETALNAIVERHEVLRTTFATVDGKPIPVIATDVHLPLPVIDLRALPAERREAEAQRLLAEEGQRPFHLESQAAEPLLRAQVLRLADDQHILQVTMHHIVSDGWSMKVFVRELATLYDVFRAGEGTTTLQIGDKTLPLRSSEAPSPLPPLPVQYVDYAAWQRQWLQDEAQTTQLAYWQKQLAGAPALLELPIDRPRPPVQTLRGRRRLFTLSPTLSHAVRSLGRDEGVTLFTTLLTAFDVLLHRYTGQDDICVGTPVAGRSRAEIEGLIGFFVNTLVLRCRLDQVPGAEGANGPTFRQLLRHMQSVAVEAYDNQDIPFEMLVDTLHPQRDMSHTPLFQVMFSVQEATMQIVRLPGLTLEPIELDSGTAKFDLTFSIVDRQDALGGALEYNTDLFDAATIDRMIGHFETLLAGIVAHPDQPIGSLPLLTRAEQQQILVDWNRTDLPVPDDDTLHERFAVQARRTPDQLAVVAEDEAGRVATLTFAELDRHSDAVAHQLRALGVQGDTLVGLAIERSPAMIVGLLGILKAGGAYVPLDPAYPADRLAMIMDDARLSALVVGERSEKVMRLIAAHTACGPAMTLVRLAERDGSMSGLPEGGIGRSTNGASPLAQLSGRPPSASAGTLAYVIYTSGSTGRPKGVMITHRSALNLAAALHHVAYAGRPGNLRISLNAPLSFDASVQQLVMLTYGHTLVIIPEETRLDVHALLAFIRRHRLDQFDCVPTQLKLLLDAGLLDPAAEWTPSIVFPGGEALDPATWQILAAAPQTEFYNMYGPTECTVDSTTANARLAPDRPTIGRPLANSRVYVLDRRLQPVPVGVPGELFIGGPGLARGYVNRPDLTAERFVPNPFVETGKTGPVLETGETGPVSKTGPVWDRLYRTGDLVRWLPDGNLEFLGRTDFQVKVRGFRIELGEIEAVLRQHPLVDDAVVVARSLASPSGGDGAAPDGSAKQLVAYLVLRRADAKQSPVAPPSVAELRDFLKQRLPDYMVPAAFVVLEAFPLTPNRKVDRNALPAPDQTGRLEVGREATLVAPTTPAEETLARIWQQLLGLPQVGIHDNFFELGGDSILSIQVIARARQAGLHLTPKQLFQMPTIAQLAAAAGQAAPVEAEQGAVTGPVPLTPIQQAFFEQQQPQPNHWNQAILLDVAEPLAPEHLRTALAAVLAQHDALRLRFQPTEAGWQQVNMGVSDEVPFAAMDLAGTVTTDLPAAITEHAAAAQASLDIVHGPLTRLLYLDLGQGRGQRLLWVIHHLAVDGVSWRILTEDLLTAYRQAVQGRRVQLPAKTSSFRAWAGRLVDYAQSPQLRQQLPFWLALAERPLPTLPTELAGPNDEGSAVDLERGLDAAQTDQLLRDVHAAYGTDVNDLLLTALALTLAPWMRATKGPAAGGPAILPVAMEGHGREDVFPGVDVSRTVGWFTSLYPLRVELPPALLAADRLGEALMAVKEQRRAVPQNGFGFGVLRYLSHDPATEPLRRLALPEISFNYLGQFDTAPTRSGADAAGSSLAFGPAAESAGPERSPANRRQHVIDFSASVVDGRLRVVWRFSANRHTPATVQRLADTFMTQLRALIAHCLESHTVAYTPSDFPEAQLSQDELDAVLAELTPL